MRALNLFLNYALFSGACVHARTSAPMYAYQVPWCSVGLTLRNVGIGW